MADLNSLKTDQTTVTDPPAGMPRRYRIIQDCDQLEIRAYYGDPENEPFLAVARFLSNLETRLFGELILDASAIRSASTLALNNLTDNDDIASFRSGAAPGDEVLRVKADGRLVLVSEATACVNVHASAFFLNCQGDTYSTSGLQIGSTYDAYMSTNDEVDQYFFCQFPTRIPQGATITGMTMTYSMMSAYDIVEVSLFRTSLTTGTGDLVTSLAGTDASATVETIDSDLMTEEIDYETYAYPLQLRIKSVLLNQSARFFALRLDYTYTWIGN